MYTFKEEVYTTKTELFKTPYGIRYYLFDTEEEKIVYKVEIIEGINSKDPIWAKINLIKIIQGDYVNLLLIKKDQHELPFMVRNFIKGQGSGNIISEQEFLKYLQNFKETLI